MVLRDFCSYFLIKNENWIFEYQSIKGIVICIYMESISELPFYDFSQSLDSRCKEMHLSMSKKGKCMPTLHILFLKVKHRFKTGHITEDSGWIF